MASVKEALAKKGGLTLSSLANYDDLITDALVDQVYFWTTIRKNRSRYSASRGIHEEEIASALRNHVIVDKDTAKGTVEILKVSGMKRYYDRLPTSDEKEHFVRHLKKYVNIYQPNCPFEVTTTNRYTIEMQEASVTARKNIKKGEVVKYLVGIQVEMTEEQEAALDGSRDFSIVLSSRKKTPSLFLGPARFANHDCNANARLDTTGSNGMQVVAVRDIRIGEEITVSYGESYFGDDNQECLCATCEKFRRNGWKDENAQDSVHDDSVIVDDISGYALRRKRKYLYEDAPSRGSTPDERPKKKRKRVAKQPPPPSARELRYAQRSNARLDRTLSKLREELPAMIEAEATSIDKSCILAIEESNTPPKPLLDAGLDDSDVISLNSPARSSVEGSSQATQSTAGTSVDGATPPADAIIVKQEETIAETSTSLIPLASFPLAVTRLEKVDSESELSEPESNYVIDEARREAWHVSNQATVLRALTASIEDHVQPETIDIIEETIRVGVAPPSVLINRSDDIIPSENVGTGCPPNDEEEDDDDSSSTDSSVVEPRFPGDYAYPNTIFLLAKPHNKWVECQTCSDKEDFPAVPIGDSWFVQEDGYLTRKECPRCERHSKLYGYVWPKTEKEGKWDSEERVMDHRTVHRFVVPDEKKGARRTESVEVERAVNKKIKELRNNERSVRCNRRASMNASGSTRRSIGKVASMSTSTEKRGRGRPRRTL